MFRDEDARTLAEFPADGFLLTTLYFQTPRTANRAHRDEVIRLRKLLREARKQWDGRELPAARVESLEQDTERILNVLAEPANGGSRDVALFACSGQSFFKQIPLPPGLEEGRAGVYVGENFRLRPLLWLQDQHPRHCVVLLDREHAYITEVAMGEVEDEDSIHDTVPPRVRANDWGGYRERRIERHADQEAARHYERIADSLHALFKRQRYDRLVLAGHKEAFSEFESHLPEDLRKRVIGSFAADPRTATGDEVRARALEAVRSADRSEKERLVAQVLNNAGPGGLGVLGLDGTLEALAKKEVQALLVGESFAAGGKRCAHCGWLGGVSRQDCPACAGPLTQSDDIVDSAISQALREDATVRFISDQPVFAAAGNIAAALRFRSESRPPQ